MIGVWPLTNEEERSSLAYLITNAPADGRYEVRIVATDEEVVRLRAEIAELKAELTELLYRLGEGDMPL